MARSKPLTNVVAKGARAKAIAANDPSIYAGVPAVSVVPRQTTSDEDALQIRVRQRDEEIPEGDVRRPGKRKGMSSY